MLFLTEDECKRWGGRWGHAEPAVEVRAAQSVDTLPASQLYWVARGALEWVRQQTHQQTLVWVYERGIWPSSEQLLLYQMMRRQHGDHQGVEQTPGHCLFRHEIEDGVAILFLCLLHGWGVQVQGDLYPYRVRINHDGRVTVYADGEASARDALERLKLTVAT